MVFKLNEILSLITFTGIFIYNDS